MMFFGLHHSMIFMILWFEILSRYLTRSSMSSYKFLQYSKNPIIVVLNLCQMKIALENFDFFAVFYNIFV